MSPRKKPQANVNLPTPQTGFPTYVTYEGANYLPLLWMRDVEVYMAYALDEPVPQIIKVLPQADCTAHYSDSDTDANLGQQDAG